MRSPRHRFRVTLTWWVRLVPLPRREVRDDGARTKGRQDMVDVPRATRQETGGVRDDGRAGGPIRYFGVPLILSGVLSVLQGVAGIAEDRLYGVPRHYEYRFDLTSWGWIHLVVGVALVIAGVGVLRAVSRGRAAGMTIAAISLVTQFMFIPYYPLWSIPVMTLDLIILWGLARMAVA
ncbi:hypothetical protein ABZ371_20355 [Streptomyces sp. NPDC005899]|uniref:DUF7144 family membrane protein n=1 Tax=Streptomyces sp. NPDC005899 TaxID=3155716 RepID=UPI00340EB895